MQQTHLLRYQEQDCSLTLREGIAEFHRYLRPWSGTNAR